MPLLDHSGNAIVTTLSAGIPGGTDLSFSITSDTGWPSGGANGKFYVTINRGGANEERILVQTRSGTTCTIAAVGDRGKDGTSAAAHSAGETVEHTFAGEEAHDYNQHLYNVSLDHHTQYMLASGTRHDLTARHSAGTVVPTGVPGAVVANQSAAEGGGTTLARAAHQHAGPVTAAPVAVGTALSAGSGTNLALANHVHELGAGSIDTASFFAAGIVDAAAIGADQVGQSELAANSVGTSELIDLNVTLAKIAHEAPTASVVTWTGTGSNPSLGNGTLAGHHIILGRLVFGLIKLSIGSTTTLGSGIWEWSIPVAYDAAWSFGDNTPFIGKVRANNSGSETHGFVGVSNNTSRLRLYDDSSVAAYGPAAPFAWGNGDFLTATYLYIAAS